MAKIGKRLKKAYQGLDPEAPPVRVEDAVKQVKSRASAKFDETVEIAMNSTSTAQTGTGLRGTVMLPHGTGKSVRVAVLPRRSRQGERKRQAMSSAPRSAEGPQADRLRPRHRHPGPDGGRPAGKT